MNVVNSILGAILRVTLLTLCLPFLILALLTWDIVRMVYSAYKH